ncbi:hypothetical protein PVK06_027523 [Gossypium arboreum]|uniref:Uncharacterized protein n=1 Tax=Gossypium arboreum TaxID=29729 RepID=A0ABR0P332_GOSAR|nr:hypothetical protein PVK06_027523 [Gossypium arboreum]
MIVRSTLLSGSKKLILHEVFTSAWDSGSLLGYIRTYVFVRFSSPYSYREMYSLELNSAGASMSINYQAPRDNPTNHVVLNLDDMVEAERARVELLKQLEDRCKWLEEKFKAMETADYHYGIDTKDLSLVPD